MIEGETILRYLGIKWSKYTDKPEIPNAAIEGPKIMIYCVLIGTFTGVIFLIVLLFVPGNIDTIISSTATPLLQIFYNATQNKAGAICLLV
jgi:choline transport protein